MEKMKSLQITRQNIIFIYFNNFFFFIFEFFFLISSDVTRCERISVFFSFNLKTYFIWKYFALFVIIIIIILYVIFHSFHYHLFTWTKRNPVSIEFYIWSLAFLVYSHYLFTSIRNSFWSKVLTFGCICYLQKGGITKIKLHCQSWWLFGA